MSAILAWRPNGPRRFPSVGYAAGAAYAASSLGPDFPPVDPGPGTGDLRRTNEVLIARQTVLRSRVLGAAPATGKTTSVVARLGPRAANTTRAGVEVGAATIQVGSLAANTTTAASPRSIAGRLQGLGANVTAKGIATAVAATLGPRAVGITALASGVSATVAARLGPLGAIGTAKAARNGIAARGRARGQNTTTVGNRVLTSVAGTTAARGQNTTVAQSFVRRHVREQIRDQYVAALKIGVPAVAGRVYAARVYPIAAGEFPGIVVYTQGDQVIETTLGEPQLQVRALEIGVQAVARAADDLDEALDNLALAVETVLSDDQLVGGLANDSDLADTAIEMVDGDQPIGAVTLTYRITYVIYEHEPWLPL